jgi:hypothetical protein
MASDAVELAGDVAGNFYAEETIDSQITAW